MFTHKSMSILGLLIALSFFMGCVAQSRNINQQETSKIKKVAVFPFYNISGRKEAGKIIANIFVAEIFKDGRYYVEEPGNILQFIIQERIDTLGEIQIERLKILNKRFGIDAVIIGTVEEFDEARGGGAIPAVSIFARMIEANSGQLVWSAQNRKKGDDYVIILDLGEVRSITAVAQKVVQEMISTIKW